jgi:hypothetical protein
MLMSTIFLVLVSVLGTGPSKRCNCESVDQDITPHGASPLVEYREKAVKQIRGKVELLNGERVFRAVVEVYRYSARDRNLRGFELAESTKRLTACLTDERGEFCLPQLPAGKYVLKVGTTSSQGFTSPYVIVDVNPRLKVARRLKVELDPGI